MIKVVISTLALLALLPNAYAQTGNAKSSAALSTEINLNFPDNTAGYINPFNTRQTLLDMVASASGAPATGSTCSPAPVLQYQTFVNTSGAPTDTTFNIYDGTQCVLWGTLNQTTHQFAVTLGNPFAVADSYMAGAANSLFLGVRGNFVSPVTDDQATAIFQTVRNNTSTQGSVPTLYVSTVKIGSGVDIINQAAQFEAVETAGNGGVAGAYGTGACTQASLGNCEGLVGIATATVAYSTLIGTEGNAINSSGTNQTTTFSSSSFNAGFMATCGGTNTCFAGFMTNPVSSSSTHVNGFYVSAGTVSDTAFRNDASLVNGVDLLRGTYSGFAIRSPGFAISPVGQIISGGTSNSTNGSLILNGLTSGNLTQTVQSVALTPTVTWGTNSGTPSVTASSPLSIATATGNITCASCVTSSGGGSITGTAPVAVSGAGVVSITGAAGEVLAGAGPTFTATPTLGNTGTSGQINFVGSSSGTLVIAASATGGHATYAGSGAAPTVTAGCNGTGGAISGTDISGTVGNQTAAATSCTVTFGTAFAAAPRCVVSGHQVAPTTVVPSTGTLVINFPSTVSAVFDWVCYGA